MGIIMGTMFITDLRRITIIIMGCTGIKSCAV